METIAEHSKLESSDSMSPPPQKQLRLCFVGDVVDDVNIVDAAKTLKIPTFQFAESCPELTSNDSNWLTFFVVKDFDGPVFEDIHKSKQCILGPPALKQIATVPHGLIPNARPIFNYSMRGVVTCFTGIRKKDELTRLVTLIHAMGGCIRKDMNSKITHLISNHSSGEKYRYAKTFRLTVVRPDWVYAAWERRNEIDFVATNDTFSQEYKLRPFEGQKICFFGFPAEEHQHMVDVLISNGGIPAELDDPDCSHVVMPKTVSFLSCAEKNTKSKLKLTSDTVEMPRTTAVDDAGIVAASAAAATVTRSTDVTNGDSVFRTELERIALMYGNEKSNVDQIECDSGADTELTTDGIVMVTEEEQQKFQMDISYISPILANGNAANDAQAVHFPNITDDSVTSEKKLKFLRTGSFARKIRYSMTAVADNTPFLRSLRQRRDSLYDADTTAGSESVLNTSSTIPCKTLALKKEQNDAKTPKTRILRARRYLTKHSDDTEGEAPKASYRRHEEGSVTSLNLLGSGKNQQQQLQFEGNRTRKRRLSEEEIDNGNRDNIFNTPNTRVLRSGRCCNMKDPETTTPKSFRKRLSRVLNGSKKPPTALNEFDNDEQGEDYNDDGNDDSIYMDISCLSTLSTSSRKHKWPLIDNNSSLKRTIRRSMHYVSEKTPLSKLLTNRRNSVTSLNVDIQQNITENESKYTNERPKKRARMEESTSNLMPEFKTPKVPPKPLEPMTSAVNRSSSSSSSIMTMTAEATATPTNTTINNISCNIICNQSSSEINQTANLRSSIGTKQILQAASEVAEYLQNPVGGSNTIVDEHSTQVKPNPVNSHTHILKSDWFWYTIQNGYADETDYHFGDYLDSIANTPDTDRRESLPISLNKRKRKRFSQRLHFEGSPLGAGKRRSSISDAVYSSFSDSFLDCTASPDTSKICVVEPETSVLESQTPAKKSLRFMHFMDFINTESNYVGILDTILKLFKIPLEEMAESGDGLLNNTEIKSIFGNFLSIHEVHQRMLERLRSIQSNWSEDSSIGEIILALKDELIKSYPPYINFFESMKEMLSYCDSQNPRFHAFLKINQTKPECGRQSLQDLMIRPVQRLPSISLLLNDILKHTGKSNPDYAKLEEALKAIKEVMTYINEDKRKTESRVAIFDIFNDIDGCPAHLVSSNRNFISKCEVLELSEELSGRGDSLMLYLFSDTIEVCKKRSRGFNSAKSPGSIKMYKHVKLLPLNAIRFVIDITDSGRAFALLCRQDKDKLYSFTIVDEEIDKIIYIKALCKQMAEHACRADAEKSLLFRTSQELNVDVSNVNLSTLSKAFKLAARTRMKVGRAFSFNKTPSKLKRAVSTMMTSPFGSTNALTPASQLAQMRLANCTNIHEATDEDGSSRSNSPPIVLLEPPLSVQPERKNKSSSTLNSLGRL